MSSLHFVDKVVIITGASSGIGFCTAVHFAKLGAKLVITGRNAARLNEAKKECIKTGATAENIICEVGEITDANVQRSLVNTAISHFGAIDILVNNAGICPEHGIIGDVGSIDVYDKIFNVNVRSVVELCRLAAEHLIKSKGCVINISSDSAKKPEYPIAYYCMSKAALDMFTKVLAQELAPKGVRVNSVNPGVVDTPILIEYTGGKLTQQQINDTFAKVLPLGRIGKPQDVANAIEFLASDKADWITGTCLAVDGGSMIQMDQVVLPNK